LYNYQLTKFSFLINEGQEGKRDLVYQWRGEEHKERVKEGEWCLNI
jgi:hypothetical protein